MPNELSEVIDKNSSVCTEGLGTFKGGKVALHIEPQVKPIFKAWPLSFLLKDKVKEELQRLKSLGIIASVKYSQWAAPVFVPVLKQNGTMYQTMWGLYIM